MQFGSANLAVVSPHASKGSGKRSASRTSALDCKGFAHNGAASGKNLKVRHAAASGRNIVISGGGGERAESGWGRFGEEGTQRPRLAKKSLHDGPMKV